MARMGDHPPSVPGAEKPSHKRGRQYRYYTRVRAIKSGRAACPSASLPAAEIERVVVEQIRCIGRDPALLAGVLAAARSGIEAEVSALRAERGDLMRELARHHTELHKLAANPAAGNAATGRLADLHEWIQRDEQRGTEIEAKLATLERERVSDADERAAFADFQNVWGQLGPAGAGAAAGAAGRPRGV
ncbi:MAG: hin 1 [Phycisphaerales bacterium]|jgi:site-specific DNA recombinase|nr:hin 1 [Phycisphaerales bacterium]